MRGSSPALAVEPLRRKAVPRPRAQLTSVDLEVVQEAVPVVARSTIPPPLPSKITRARRHRGPIPTPPTSRPELLDGVVTALGDLPFFETLVEASAYCLVTALKAVPALGGLALLRDEGSDEGGYRVVYARGPRAYELVRSRIAEDDATVAAALVRGGCTMLDYGEGRRPPERHVHFGDPWTAIVVPAQDEERCLAVFELVDPLDGRSLGDSARETLSAIARAFAEATRTLPRRVGDVFAPEQVGLID
jgi:hypothetical protein